MTTTPSPEDPPAAGLRAGSLGMATSLILATASAAPAYSLAATMAFIVAFVGFQAPAIVLLAFIPILFVSFGYAALNRANPDCGTIFAWASNVLGPRIGFMGGFAIIASFVLVMGSLAQVAGQYVFLLFGADGIGGDPSSTWVLLVGLGWIALMTAVCYRGIEVAAAVQRALLFLEFGMLVVFSVVALVKVYSGHAGPTAQKFEWSWFNPFEIPTLSAFVSGLVLMLFIYWGWESAVTVNEETADRRRTPGRAAVYSTVLLLALYLVATIATLSVAGIGTEGIGLGNPDNFGDVFSALGGAVFGTTGIGSVFFHLLVLMVLTSAAASTETTVLTLGRTMLSMGRHGGMPRTFATVHPRFAIPRTGTIATGVVGALFYVVMNYLGNGLVIGDAVSACALLIALYYGLTGITSAVAYRSHRRRSATDRWLRVTLPGIGGVVLFGAGIWSLVNGADPANGYTSWTLPFGDRQIGGVFLIGVGSFLVGIILLLVWTRVAPEFFSQRLQLDDDPEDLDGPLADDRTHQGAVP